MAIFARTAVRGRQAASQAASSVSHQVSHRPAAAVSMPKREISFGNRATDPSARKPGHAAAVLSAHENSLVGEQGASQHGWTGGSNRIKGVENPPPTVFTRKGQTHTFQGVTKEGKADPVRPVSAFEPHDTVDLGDLNKLGVEAVKEFSKRYEMDGTVKRGYNTTSKSKVLPDGRRANNCVGFTEDLVQHLSGVELQLDEHAFTQDAVEAIRQKRAEIRAGMKAKGHL